MVYALETAPSEKVRELQCGWKKESRNRVSVVEEGREPRKVTCSVHSSVLVGF